MDKKHLYPNGCLTFFWNKMFLKLRNLDLTKKNLLYGYLTIVTDWFAKAAIRDTSLTPIESPLHVFASWKWIVIVSFSYMDHL